MKRTVGFSKLKKNGKVVYGKLDDSYEIDRGYKNDNHNSLHYNGHCLYGMSEILKICCLYN